MGFVAIWASGRAVGPDLWNRASLFLCMKCITKSTNSISPHFFCFLVRRCLLLNQTYTVLRTEAKKGRRRSVTFGRSEMEKKLCFIFFPLHFCAIILRIRGKRGAYHNYSARPIHAKSIIIPIVLGSEFSRPILNSFFWRTFSPFLPPIHSPLPDLIII